MSASDEPCRLREIEYDGSRYCGTHFGFAYRGEPMQRCDRSPIGQERPNKRAEKIPNHPADDDDRCGLLWLPDVNGSRS